ncbi:MAG: SGNH/GDSL hydrolase family protein [Verrucomicrobiae bacterium]|nr:SGNH/GDSL hydrolase family protein [Verrucomicrobiae bacterium]
MRSVLSADLRWRIAVGIWITLMLAGISVYFWLDCQTLEIDSKKNVGVSPIYLGYAWLRFHRVWQPEEKGEKRIVVLGASAIAGWGLDYRWSTRGRVDPWGRRSFSALLEKQMRRSDGNVRVVNLAVNGIRLRSIMFLHLVSLKTKPQLVVLGFTSGFLGDDGDFRWPWSLRSMNRHLEELLDDIHYPGKKDVEASFREYLRRQPSGWVRVRLNPSFFDHGIARMAWSMRHGYEWMGLPEFQVVPTPHSFLENRLRKKTAMVRSEKLEDGSLVSEQEMLKLFPDALAIMKKTAEASGVKWLVLVPPCQEGGRDDFYDRRIGDMKKMGVKVVDLRRIPMQMGTDIYDGSHFTAEGNEKLAAAFKNALDEMGGLQ